MYQISNKKTLGVTEQDIVKNLKVVVEKIVKQERMARKFLTKDKIELEDEKGYKYTYMETEGGHIWRNWRVYLTEFAQKIFK